MKVKRYRFSVSSGNGSTLRSRRRLRRVYSDLLALILLILTPGVPCAPGVSFCPPVTFADHLRAVSVSYGVPENVVRAVISTESTWNPNAIGKDEEVGLMQVKVPTAREVTRTRVTKRDLLDPFTNVEIGVRFLSKLRDQFGSISLALTAYSRGPGKVERDRKANAYSRKVLKLSRRLTVSPKEMRVLERVQVGDTSEKRVQ